MWLLSSLEILSQNDKKKILKKQTPAAHGNHVGGVSVTIAELPAAAFGKATVCGGNCVTNNTRWRKSTWPPSGMVFIIVTKTD